MISLSAERSAIVLWQLSIL